MNIAILGCGHIAHRIAKGIKFSNGTLYAVASRDVKKAQAFASLYDIPHAYTYEECMKDEQVDLIYIATINATHYSLTEQCLLHHKHVICEKPFVENTKQLEELFDLAQKQQCFLMEAHKTCFTPLNTEMKKRIHEIGEIQHITAKYCRSFDLNGLSEANKEEKMGGCFYDVGVYPICFANLFSDSKITTMHFNVKNHDSELVDFEGKCQLIYQNGIVADLSCSWIYDEPSYGIITGSKGEIKILDYWKNNVGLIMNEEINVEQKSDFTGEINHAIECIKKGLLESPVMSRKASLEIVKVLEEMKKQRY